MTKQTPRITFLMAIVGFTVSVFSARAESNSNLLGIVDFPNSGAVEAQADFVEGLLYLHNFEYAQAAPPFKRAQEIDPDFAMAYWGEAMCYNHPLWAQQAKRSAVEALQRLGRDPEARRAKAGTEREKDFLMAVEILYGTVGDARGLPKNDRDDLYRDHMRRVSLTYPDDHEAATFYGLSILGSAHEGRDSTTYMKAAAVLTGVWDANRLHPGAAHYLIHSYDDPVHAPLGLPMARAYSKIAPGAAHAQHMVSHIFVALGQWDDVVVANQLAIEAEGRDGGRKNDQSTALGHYPHWLEYGYLEQGRYKEAREMMDAGYAAVTGEPVGRERMYYAFMFSRYVVDTEDWAAADRWAVDYSTAEVGARDYTFAQAYAAVHRGDLVASREHLSILRECRAEFIRPAQRGILETLAKEIEGLIALKEGKSDEAIALLNDATRLEESVPMNFGPPPIRKPSSELLGEALLALDRAEEAVNAFEAQLTRTPGRTATLLGLARAAKAVGDEAKSRRSYLRLSEIWHSADKGIANYDEVFARIEG